MEILCDCNRFQFEKSEQKKMKSIQLYMLMLTLKKTAFDLKNKFDLYAIYMIMITHDNLPQEVVKIITQVWYYMCLISARVAINLNNFGHDYVQMPDVFAAH